MSLPKGIINLNLPEDLAIIPLSLLLASFGGCSYDASMRAIQKEDKTLAIFVICMAVC
jgi:uncharacterized OsmC-like protein